MCDVRIANPGADARAHPDADPNTNPNAIWFALLRVNAMALTPETGTGRFRVIRSSSGASLIARATVYAAPPIVVDRELMEELSVPEPEPEPDSDSEAPPRNGASAPSWYQSTIQEHCVVHPVVGIVKMTIHLSTRHTVEMMIWPEVDVPQVSCTREPPSHVAQCRW